MTARHRIVTWELLALLMGILAVLLLGTPRAHADELAQSFPASEPGRVRIALDFGHVEVVPAQAGEVRIEAESRGVGASGVHFDARSEGADVVLTGRAEPWVAWLQSGPRVHVRAFVPETWVVDLAGAGAGAPVGSFLVVDRH
jgi:hypothetical protein